MATYRVKSTKPIRSAKELHEHLVDAARLELSTIPLYLYALYSLKSRVQPAPSSSASRYTPLGPYEVIRAVVIEEMLHLLLVRNLITAIHGAAPEGVKFYEEAFVPTYPGPMLHRKPALELRLARISPEQLDTFIQLELPEKGRITGRETSGDTYHTIAELYAAIDRGLESLDGPKLWSDPRASYQVSDRYDPYWNQSGRGGPVLVSSLKEAKAAIHQIVVQGEGNPRMASDPDQEYAHYPRFKLLLHGPETIDYEKDVWPLETNPDPSSWPEPVRKLSELFDGAYSYLLKIIDEAYAIEYPKDKPERHPKRKLLQNMLTSMGAVLYPLADILVRQPVGSDEKGNPVHAGPTFRFRHIEGRSGKERRKSLLDQCDRLAHHYPSLVGENSPRSFIEMLAEV